MSRVSKLRTAIAQALILAACLVALAGSAERAAGAGSKPARPSAPFIGEVAEGDDYFTHVLSDPLDFDNPDDVSIYLNMIRVTMAGGIWTGTATSGDGNLFLLHFGFDYSAQGIDSRNGVVYPIYSASYSRLVVKYHASQATDFAAYWYGSEAGANQIVGRSDTYHARQGDNIIDIDLNERSSGYAWDSRDSWRGLRIDPSEYHSNVLVQLDWARLIPAAGGPLLPVAWSCPSCAGLVDFYAGTGAELAGSGAARLATGLDPAAGDFAIPTAALPPGSYNLFAVEQSSGTAHTVGSFRVRPMPLLKLTAPSTLSGDDYTTVMGLRPWDMTSPAAIQDFENLREPPQIAGGVLTGHSRNGDPAIFLVGSRAGPSATGVNTGRFKYLNFSMKLLDPNRDPNNVVHNDFGVIRVLWYDSPLHGNPTADIINWYNYTQHYSLVLSTTRVMDDPTVNAVPWTTQESWKILRLDPHETPESPEFQLGPVHLTADPAVRQGHTTRISWRALQGDGRVSLYYATNRDQVGQPIPGATDLALRNGSSAENSFDWNMGNLTPGSYWISAVVDDGESSTVRHSDAPLRVTLDLPAHQVEFSTPNGQANASGEGADFFTEQLGDPIDFRNAEDAVEQHGWNPLTINDGVLTGTPATEDAHFYLLFPGYDSVPNSGRGQTHQVDPGRYDHLVFKYTLSGLAPGQSTNPRLYWMAPGSPQRHAIGWKTGDTLLEEGTHFYDMDLNSNDGGENNADWHSQQWGGLRFQPASFLRGGNATIRVYWVRLVKGTGTRTIPTNYSCLDCTFASFDIYADDDRDPANGMIKLLDDVSTRSTSAAVPIDKLAAGSYYLVADNQGNPPSYSAGDFNVVATNGFVDVDSSNVFQRFIDDLAQRGIIDGSGSSFNTFRSNENALRRMLIRWIVRGRGWTLVNPARPSFTDVPLTDPDYRYIETAVANQVINGYSDPTRCPGGQVPCFNPDAPLTRGQMSKIIVNAMGWPIDESGGPHFSDLDRDNVFYSLILTIYNRITPDGQHMVDGYTAPGSCGPLAEPCFKSGNNVTRGQVTKFLGNAIAIGPER